MMDVTQPLAGTQDLHVGAQTGTAQYCLLDPTCSPHPVGLHDRNTDHDEAESQKLTLQIMITIPIVLSGGLTSIKKNDTDSADDADDDNDNNNGDDNNDDDDDDNNSNANNKKLNTTTAPSPPPLTNSNGNLPPSTLSPNHAPTPLQVG
jgi:hypothetical protein